MDREKRRQKRAERFVVEFDEPDAAADVQDLAGWLDDDADLRGRAAVRMRGPDPGEQGGVADAVLVTASAASLTDPLVDWIRRRATTRQVRVRVTAPSGAAFIDDAIGRTDGERLARRLQEFLDNADEDSDGTFPGDG